MKLNPLMTQGVDQIEDKSIEMMCNKCGEDFDLIDASHEGNLVPKCPICKSPELEILKPSV